MFTGKNGRKTRRWAIKNQIYGQMDIGRGYNVSENVGTAEERERAFRRLTSLNLTTLNSVAKGSFKDFKDMLREAA